MNDIKASEVSELIRNRRSIYPAQYTSEQVDDTIIHEMLENANWAPTHKLTEPWRFVVFKGEGLKKLAKFQSELYRDVSQKKGTFNEVTFEKLGKNPLMSSHIIAIGMKRNESVPEVEEVASVAMAVQNMYLTATAHGIGCYWGSGGVTFYEEAKAFFGLEPQDKLLGFLYIGNVKDGFQAQGRRKPIDEKASWVI